MSLVSAFGLEAQSILRQLHVDTSKTGKSGTNQKSAIRSEDYFDVDATGLPKNAHKLCPRSRPPACTSALGPKASAELQSRIEEGASGRKNANQLPTEPIPLQLTGGCGGGASSAENEEENAAIENPSGAEGAQSDSSTDTDTPASAAPGSTAPTEAAGETDPTNQEETAGDGAPAEETPSPNASNPEMEAPAPENAAPQPDAAAGPEQTPSAAQPSGGAQAIDQSQIAHENPPPGSIPQAGTGPTAGTAPTAGGGPMAGGGSTAAPSPAAPGPIAGAPGGASASGAEAHPAFVPPASAANFGGVAFGPNTPIGVLDAAAGALPTADGMGGVVGAELHPAACGVGGPVAVGNASWMQSILHQTTQTLLLLLLTCQKGIAGQTNEVLRQIAGLLQKLVASLQAQIANPNGMPRAGLPASESRGAPGGAAAADSWSARLNPSAPEIRWAAPFNQHRWQNNVLHIEGGPYRGCHGHYDRQAKKLRVFTAAGEHVASQHVTQEQHGRPRVSSPLATIPAA